MDIALAIIVDHPRDRVLIHLRPADVHLPNLWEFPGGKLEPGESPGDAAIREALEETGLTVAILEPWDQVVFSYPERAVTLHPYLCEPVANTPPRQGWIWSPIDRLGEYEFPEANQPLIERLVARQSPAV